ncbi:response regulator transcription factor [Oceanirhabdus sp. W0125-5]|uniref:response regulator transcription factor n=1 Tax=Oceanirhabdus sp. W0125-5 TaxID=2999116 RepID=UPI0022F2C627|nr:response regulator transcription factor [Oceanirhabdus sp. W0125-5]WBW97017.1 response regulator transcription factor [Oceanirhabdus sp. W0125-5]
MEKILIIDDDIDILSLIYDALSDEGYVVYKAENSNEAIEYLNEEIELILMDVMMPGKNGFELCRDIRDMVDCPIIFITAKTEEKDMMKGLAVGGDDYITKPFSIKILKARVAAHLRRDKRNINKEKKFIAFHNLNIDLKSREILFNGVKIQMTKREFDIIELLAMNSGQVFSKERIYEGIWGYDAEGDSSTVSEHIKKVRAKLAKVEPNVKYIDTVWGVGYRWGAHKKGSDESA